MCAVGLGVYVEAVTSALWVCMMWGNIKQISIHYLNIFVLQKVTDGNSSTALSSKEILVLVGSSTYLFVDTVIW